MRRSLWICIIGLKVIGIQSTILNIEVQNKSCFSPYTSVLKEVTLITATRFGLGTLEMH